MTDYLDQPADYRAPNLASAFDELSFWSSHFGRLLFEHVELRRGITVLDLACGTGFPIIQLAMASGASCRFVGVDPWREGLERAALKRDTYGLDHVALVRGDGARLPLQDASIDLVVSNLGINNFDDPAAVLAECARVAKPDARIALTTNLVGHMREFYAIFRDVIASLNRPDYLDRLAANEAHRGTPESVRALLEAAGFAVTRVIEGQFTMRYLDGSAFLRHGLTRFGFLPAWRAVVDPADERAVFAELERRLNALADRHGELRLTIPMLYVEGVRR